MSSDSTPLPSLAELRALARLQGIEPTDDDLDAVLGFLATVLPTLRALEEQTGRDIPPAGMYYPDAEAT